MKRGSVTLFIIMGILFLAILGFALSTNSTLRASLGFPQTSEMQVQGFVESCMEKTTEHGLLRLGEHGGKLEGEQSLPLPELETAKESLEGFIEKEVVTCLDGFSALQGMSIQAGDIKAKVFFTIRETEVELSYPLEITDKDGIEHIADFEISVPVRYRLLHQAAQELALEFMEHGGVDMTLLSSKDFETALYQEDDVMVVFKDARSKIGTSTYWFHFGLI